VSKRRKHPRTGRAGGPAAGAAPSPKVREEFVARPFQGLIDEPEWVALRELVPAASAPLRVRDDIAEGNGDGPVTVATVLPMAWPAIRKPDGRILLGLQRYLQSGDPSRDLAVALLAALATEPGTPVSVPTVPGPGPRLQDVLVDGLLEVTVHTDFDFWLDADAADDAEVKASLERANASVHPTTRLTSVRSAYWAKVPEKAHVRWVLPDAEEPALRALARLSAAGTLTLGEQTKFAGMFRAHGLLIPVWDVPGSAAAEEWDAPLGDFAKRYADALADDSPTTPAQRRARQGLVGRQLTLR
jgi:hypothetical protein